MTVRNSQEVSLKERVRMALSEAGYPDAEISGSHADPVVGLLDSPREGGVPAEVCWKAFRVARCEMTPGCFDCWHEGYDESECPHPWPEVADAG